MRHLALGAIIHPTIYIDAQLSKLCNSSKYKNVNSKNSPHTILHSKGPK